MRITERQIGNVMVLDLRGAFSGPKAAEMLGSVVRRHCQDGTRHLVANLGGVPSVDLAGLGALVDAYSAMREAKGILALAGVTKRIHDLLVITRLLTVFDTYDSIEDVAGEAVPASAATKGPEPSVESLGMIQRFLRRA